MGDPEDLSVDGSRWQDRLRSFVFSHLPDPAARVLEVGCGKDGELAFALHAAGNEVVAVDPDAPEGAIFHRTTIEELSVAGPFDIVIASRSLHHIADLDAALNKVVSLMAPGAEMLVLEWGWDLVDDATVEWAFARMPSATDEPVGWLQKARARWEDAHSSDSSITFPKFLAALAQEEGFHDSHEMVTSLDERFQPKTLEWGPYFFPYLEGVTENAEMQAIARGELRATSLRYVGTHESEM